MFFSTVSAFALQCLSWVAMRLGITFLTREETIDYLRPYQQGFHPANTLLLPEVTDAAEPTKLIFELKTAKTEPSYTWVYKSEGRKTSQLRCGNIMTDGTVLCPDYWNKYLLKDSFRLKKRRTYNTNTLVAPISFYQDGDVFGGYYDYLFLVAAKLCRIKQDSPASLFSDAVISYPLFNTPYEHEFLSYIGFTQNQILDSRDYDVRFQTCLLGNNTHWFYPNQADVQAIRRGLFPLIQSQENSSKRLYISRSGRRRIANEDALVKLLQQYDFVIVEDKPRSLSEQLSLYHQASFILGPHGASFSNIIWCKPGTHLFELFSPNYAPDFFLYLARLTGLTYSAYCQGPKRYTPAYLKPNALSEDITVSLSDIERSLNQYFTSEVLNARR